MLYNWEDYIYQIDDTNIDCWKILVAWCDPYIHEYVDPCTIVSDCLDSIWWPDIDRCDMVDGIEWAEAWAFLRIDNTWNCVEFIDPDTVFASYNTDRLVSVDWTDPAWHLNTKIISSDWSINITNTWWELDLSTWSVETFLGLSDTPSTYSWHDGDLVSVSWGNLVFTENDRSQRANRMLNADVSIVWSPNEDKRFFPSPSYGEWNPSMLVSTWWIWAIEIQKTGMYNIWMNWWFYVNKWVNAAKIVMMTTEWGDKKLLLNSKAWIFPSWHPIVMEDLWETHRFFAFSEKSLVKLEAWTKLYLAVRISSNAGNNVVPEVVIEWQSLVTWDLSWTWPDSTAYRYCGTLIWCSYYGPITHNAQ